MRDIAAFGLGAVACLVGGIAISVAVGSFNAALISWIVPITLIAVGIVMLALTRPKKSGKE